MCPSALDELLRHKSVWTFGSNGPAGPDALAGHRAAQLTATSAGHSIPTGFQVLDDALPSGGWPVGALIELLSAYQGFGELRLLMPALVDVTVRGRQVLWIVAEGEEPGEKSGTSGRVPYAPALARQGVMLSRVLLVRHASWTDRLWAAEQALRSGACGLVLLWEGDERLIHQQRLRRLQIAAQAGQSSAVLYRVPERSRHPSPAVLRLLLEPDADAEVRYEPGAEPALHSRLDVRVLKCRGRVRHELLRIGRISL